MPTNAARDPLLVKAREQGLFSALDEQFASRLAGRFGEERSEIIWALALACRQEAQGHVCADLPRLSEERISVERDGVSELVSALPSASDLDSILAALKTSPLIDALPEVQEEARPLILDARNRLYLRRSYRDEATLADQLRRRASKPNFELDEAWAESAIRRIAGVTEESTKDFDEPIRALRVGLERPIQIVTGGPGTGKTTLLARLVALVAEAHMKQGASAPVIRLLAPTGKAAAAMTASFERQRETLSTSDSVRDALPATAETIHRFVMRHVRQDALGEPRIIPVEADMLVIDEASMVDLSLMRQVFEIGENVDRIVLLGDPDQLASVDSGAALAEICTAADPSSRASQNNESPFGAALSVVRLKKSHRFSETSAIGRLAQAVREGDADCAIEILEDSVSSEVEWVATASAVEVQSRLAESVVRLQRDLSGTQGADEKLACLASHRILCAHRGGPLGVESLCRVLDAAAAESRQTTSRSGWWAGRLVLVTRNAPEQDLWNGDVGLVEETGDGLRAIFAAAGGAIRSLSEGRLPTFESAIAMSVHKSQGSEFDAVDLVLGQRPSRLMTRELLYTGVTRAREKLSIFASEAVLRAAIERRVVRDSGLIDRLIKPTPEQES